MPTEAPTDTRWTGHVDIDGPRWYGAPDLIGKDVVALSNENEPPIVGTLIRYEPLARCHCPVVRAPDGEEYWVLGLLLPAHPEILDFITLHGGKKTFNLLRDMRWLWLHEQRQIDARDAESRRASTPSPLPPPKPVRPWWQFWS
jgi:hypothetical protein